jgi:hypothetical protein
LRLNILAPPTLAAVAALSLVSVTLGWASETGRVEGLIVLSPATPLSRPGVPNQWPIRGRVAVIDRQGNVVAHADSNEAGVFRLDLMPGSYTLHLESTGSFGRATDVQVSVVAGQATKVVITYDAGIR